ncbi:MAG: 1-(5-phosphoribosyl)-5-[(5-phosphoribosylamino)methylideneamino]imidazole-4-carboxamide isomerase [Chloroflexota bacterium]
MFELIPAIDLHGGKCVRLTQGDYSQQTVYGDDPPAMAERWESLGAGRIHTVDLEAAAAGEPVQLEVIARIVQRVRVPVQMGGGMRAPEHVQAAFDAGVDSVILGTALITDPDFADWCLTKYADRIILGLDAREGRVAVRGWLERTDVLALDIAQDFARRGAKTVIYTDISRDGMLGGPNVDGVGAMVRASGMRVIASGGVSTMGHITALRDVGAAGAILGKAIYTGDLDLRAALAAVVDVP